MSTSSRDAADPLPGLPHGATPLPPPVPGRTAGSNPESTPVPVPVDADPVRGLDARSADEPVAGSSAVIGMRGGQLTLRWRFVLGAAWVAAFFAYAAVWQASVQIGIGTWWIGPRGQPTNTIVRVLPFVLCITLAMCAIYDVSRVRRLSALGVGLATIFAIPDFSRSSGLAVTELVIAGLLGLVTAVASTGTYRLAPVRAGSGLDADVTRDETSDASVSMPAPADADRH